MSIAFNRITSSLLTLTAKTGPAVAETELRPSAEWKTPPHGMLISSGINPLMILQPVDVKSLHKQLKAKKQELDRKREELAAKIEEVNKKIDAERAAAAQGERTTKYLPSPPLLELLSQPRTATLSFPVLSRVRSARLRTSRPPPGELIAALHEISERRAELKKLEQEVQNLTRQIAQEEQRARQSREFNQGPAR